MEYLCARGADVNRGLRSSSLHYAACFGRPQIVLAYCTNISVSVEESLFYSLYEYLVIYSRIACSSILLTFPANSPRNKLTSTYLSSLSLLTPAPPLVFHVHVLSCLLGRRSLITDEIASTVSLRVDCWRKVRVPCVRVEWIESLRGRPWVPVLCAYDYGIHRYCVLFAVCLNCTSTSMPVCLCIDVAALRCEHGAARRGGKAGGREGARTQLRSTHGSGGHSAHAAYVAFDSCIREQRSNS